MITPATLLLASILSVSTLVDLALGAPVAVEGELQTRDGTPVYVSSLDQCPTLAPRATAATSVNDLRPDDISYTLALGDSITAGAFSRGIQSDVLKSFSEWRGESYAGGMDTGAITVPNLIKHYNPSVSGGSIGSNDVVELCYGPLCPIGPIGWDYSVDRLNGALSGALASNLYHEVVDYLIPQTKARGVPAKAFKYLNLQIGSNDLCSMCFTSTTGIGPGSGDVFEGYIRKTLEAVRKGIPNTVVNLVGVFKVSDVYTMTLNQPYCSQLLPVPHENLECPCMLLGGSVGNATRTAMDNLMNEYNSRLIKIAKDYQTAQYSDFAVLWQPPNIPLASFPVQALSSVDCFHPSIKTHQLIASAIWNRLVGDATVKSQTIAWSDNLQFRCLQDGDRLQTKTLV